MYGLTYQLIVYMLVVLKGHCIEFNYYADGLHSGLTPRC